MSSYLWFKRYSAVPENFFAILAMDFFHKLYAAGAAQHVFDHEPQIVWC